MSKTYIHPRLGEIIIRKSRLSKRVRLAVHPINGISVTVPWLVSYSRAIAFVEEKEEWIAATLLKQSKKRNEEAVQDHS
jgi:predicted metal-dependent hydrolase